MFLTGMFLNYVHGGVNIVVRLPERGHCVHLMEAHLLQSGDVPFRKQNQSIHVDNLIITMKATIDENLTPG